MQDPADGGIGNAMAHLVQGLFEVGHTLGGPLEMAHWIPFRLQQALQIPKQCPIALYHLFPAAPTLADSGTRSIAVSCFDFPHAVPDGILGDACLSGYLGKVASLLG